MYGLFKENGPYLVGWDAETGKTFLVPNKFSWTRDHHMLYIDNPVGAGFSFTGDMSGYPRTDSEVAESLLSAVRQFMKLYPFMTRGRPAANATRGAIQYSLEKYLENCLEKYHESTVKKLLFSTVKTFPIQ